MHDGSQRSLSDVPGWSCMRVSATFGCKRSVGSICAELTAKLRLIDGSLDDVLLRQMYLPLNYAYNIPPEQVEVTTDTRENQAVASAFFLQETALLQSCVPNAAVVTLDRTMQVRAMQAITAGSPVTVTFFDPLQPKQQRQQLLLLSFGVACTCVRCTGTESQAERLDLTRFQLRKDKACLAACLAIQRKYGIRCDPALTTVMFREMRTEVTAFTSMDVLDRKQEQKLQLLLKQLNRELPMVYGSESHAWSSFVSLKQQLRDKGFVWRIRVHARSKR